MGLGKRYWLATISSLSEQQKVRVEPYVRSIKKNLLDGVGLYLWGNNSSGKTHIGAALCKYVWGNFRVASYFISAPHLYEAMKKNAPAQEGSEETVMERVKNVRFLVIDDLGREYRAQSGFMEAELCSLLRSRVSHNKTTVITSNLSPQEIHTNYGQSVSELLKEVMITVRLSGENWREVKADEIRK